MIFIEIRFSCLNVNIIHVFVKHEIFLMFNLYGRFGNKMSTDANYIWNRCFSARESIKGKLSNHIRIINRVYILFTTY